MSSSGRGCLFPENRPLRFAGGPGSPTKEADTALQHARQAVLDELVADDDEVGLQTDEIKDSALVAAVSRHPPTNHEERTQ
jgi:hypothetical protein